MPDVLPRVERPDRDEGGQTLVEAAIAFPILLLVTIGLVQFALFWQAESVITGAVQDGARVAAVEDRTVADGVARTQALLHAALGRTATGISVRGVDGGSTVTIEAHGRLLMIIPWVGGGSIPLGATSMMSKERFSVGPNG